MKVSDLVRRRQSAYPTGWINSLGIIIEVDLHTIDNGGSVLVQWSGDYGRFWTSPKQLILVSGGSDATPS